MPKQCRNTRITLVALVSSHQAKKATKSSVGFLILACIKHVHVSRDLEFQLCMHDCMCSKEHKACIHPSQTSQLPREQAQHSKHAAGQTSGSNRAGSGLLGTRLASASAAHPCKAKNHSIKFSTPSSNSSKQQHQGHVRALRRPAQVWGQRAKGQ